MINIETGKPLADHTTFRVGGEAKYFVEVSSEDELLEAVRFGKRENLPIFVLGGGSNVLISDKGFPGLAILVRIKGIEISGTGMLRASAGEGWDEVVEVSVKRDLAGVECLSGVPGFVGGAVVQNIGCYGQTLGDVIVSVRALDIRIEEFKEFRKEECRFAYRSSFFKNNPDFVVTRATLGLVPDGQPVITYHDVLKYFENGPKRPSLSQVREAVLKIRETKGMVVRPDVDSYKSAGSYFTNPIVSPELFSRIRTEVSSGDGRPWHWEVPNFGFKLAAAKLISQAGFEKGFMESERVGISPKQPLAIINAGGASASEIRRFAGKIKSAVKDRFGVDLEEEVVYIGDF